MRTSPPIHYPPELPISAEKERVAALVREHQVVVLCGETGSGKSTQLPKICLELGRGREKLIGHTQPRRIAARSLAARVAKELKTTLGETVGFKVRFTDRVGPGAMVKLMTDGILLAEIRHDPLLQEYDTIIVDEAHERSLNIDFLLGYLKRILPRRPDLKLIVTSATIDPQRFSRHFGDCPVIEVSGRTYPVEVRWEPVVSEEPDEEDPTMLDAIVAAVKELIQSQPQADGAGARDILVFLSGQREIRETAEELNKQRVEAEVLPLYAALSAEEQDRVFEPHAQRRVILATNVAETSLTVPGIHAVIDPGLARISRYHQRLRIQRLPIEPVSQASARQRAGRCGRVADGICIRLYSEEDFNAREPYTAPEILRANLAGVILQMKSLRLGEVEDFPFIDPPSLRMVEAGYETLVEIGAVDAKRGLTGIGRALSRLPVDPRLGRMILAAIEEGCLEEVLIIVSALAVQDPRQRPMEQTEAADAAHLKFRDEHSDFLTLLNLWEAFQSAQRTLSGNQLRKWCRERYFSYLRFREWQDVHRQLALMVKLLPDSLKARNAIERAIEGAPPTRGAAPAAERAETAKKRRRRRRGKRRSAGAISDRAPRPDREPPSAPAPPAA
jgi:ATP-dependent helicase HrpA